MPAAGGWGAPLAAAVRQRVAAADALAAAADPVPAYLQLALALAVLLLSLVSVCVEGARPLPSRRPGGGPSARGRAVVLLLRVLLCAALLGALVPGAVLAAQYLRAGPLGGLAGAPTNAWAHAVVRRALNAHAAAGGALGAAPAVGLGPDLLAPDARGARGRAWSTALILVAAAAAVGAALGLLPQKLRVTRGVFVFMYAQACVWLLAACAASFAGSASRLPLDASPLRNKWLDRAYADRPASLNETRFLENWVVRADEPAPGGGLRRVSRSLASIPGFRSAFCAQFRAQLPNATAADAADAATEPAAEPLPEASPALDGPVDGPVEGATPANDTTLPRANGTDLTNGTEPAPAPGDPLNASFPLPMNGTDPAPVDPPPPARAPEPIIPETAPAPGDPNTTATSPAATPGPAPGRAPEPPAVRLQVAFSAHQAAPGRQAEPEPPAPADLAPGPAPAPPPAPGRAPDPAPPPGPAPTDPPAAPPADPAAAPAPGRAPELEAAPAPASAPTPAAPTPAVTGAAATAGAASTAAATPSAVATRAAEPERAAAPAPSAAPARAPRVPVANPDRLPEVPPAPTAEPVWNATGGPFGEVAVAPLDARLASEFLIAYVVGKPTGASHFRALAYLACGALVAAPAAVAQLCTSALHLPFLALWLLLVGLLTLLATPATLRPLAAPRAPASVIKFCGEPFPVLVLDPVTRRIALLDAAIVAVIVAAVVVRGYAWLRVGERVQEIAEKNDVVLVDYDDVYEPDSGALRW